MVSKKIKDQAIVWFTKKYPRVKIYKFVFGYNLNDEGHLKLINVYYMITPRYKDWILITDNRFISNENCKYLYGEKANTQKIVSNIKKGTGEQFPKIWSSKGTVQELPKGKRHVGFFGKTYYWDNFPTMYVLHYNIDAFRIYVNNNDFFNSSLPPLIYNN